MIREIEKIAVNISKKKEEKSQLFSEWVWHHLFYDMVSKFSEAENPEEITVRVGDILVEYAMPEEEVFLKRSFDFFNAHLHFREIFSMSLILMKNNNIINDN